MTVALWLFWLSIAAFVGLLNWHHQRTLRNGEWHTYGLDKMRRRIGGRWQTRQMTNEEARREEKEMAW